MAVVTGSTSGIGEGIAHAFAHEGASVVIHGRNRDSGRRVIEDIVRREVPRERLSFFGADLADEAQCRALVRHAVERFGGLDVLVNNAADYTRGDIETTTVELWDLHMALNLRAPFILTQEAVRVMRERGGGSIVNIGSVNAYVGGSNLTSYSVSKGGLMTFTKNVAQQVNRDGIRVNQVNVGWTLTQGEDRVRQEEDGPGWLERAVASRPFGRMLLPRDVALAVLYFASDDSALVTGSVLEVEQYPIGC